MKPNKYIQNSDYLSLGQIQKISISDSFSAVTLSTYGQQFQTATHSISVDKGSIVGCQVRYNGGDWFYGNVYNWGRIGGSGSTYRRVTYLYKTTNNQITIKSVCQNYATGYSVTVPAATVDFVVTFFKPPNI